MWMSVAFMQLPFHDRFLRPWNNLRSLDHAFGRYHSLRNLARRGGRFSACCNIEFAHQLYCRAEPGDLTELAVFEKESPSFTGQCRCPGQVVVSLRASVTYAMAEPTKDLYRLILGVYEQD